MTVYLLTYFTDRLSSKFVTCQITVNILKLVSCYFHLTRLFSFALVRLLVS